MNHDEEKTTEIVIPPKPLTGTTPPPPSNIVHVDFPRVKRAGEKRDLSSLRGSGASASAVAQPYAAETPWLRDVDLKAPWVIRLLAVAVVVILSMLLL